MIEWYTKPLRAVFSDSGLGRWIVSIYVGILWGLWQDAQQVYTGLLEVPPSLLVVVFTLWLLDLLSGVMRAIRTNGVGSIKSGHLRRSIVKFLEYLIAIVAADMLASTQAYVGFLGPLVEHVGNIVAVLISVTEFKSIDENLDLSITRRLKGIMSERITGEES